VLVVKKINLLIVFASISLLSVAFAQDAVPGEILHRTMLIKIGNLYGTGFKVDYQGKIYVVTARHLVVGLPDTNATIQVWEQGQWRDYHTLRTIFPSSADVDIAVFQTEETVSQPYTIKPESDETGGTTFGQQVWFLGFPWQLGTDWNGGKLPFLKRGTMSAVDGTNPNAVVYYIDGFNNPGFSGGPIVYWSFSKHVYGILAVVKGYKEDTAKVLINGEHVDTKLLVNSGILIGYSITHAMKAIEDSEKQAHPH
jgi:hypothetical protein